MAIYLLVEGLDFFHFVVTAQVDTRAIVDVLGLYLQHPLHFTVDSLATSWKGVMLAF